MSTTRDRHDLLWRYFGTRDDLANRFPRRHPESFCIDLPPVGTRLFELHFASRQGQFASGRVEQCRLGNGAAGYQFPGGIASSDGLLGVHLTRPLGD